MLNKKITITIYIVLLILIGFFSFRLIFNGKNKEDFSKGVLAINTNKYSFLPGERMEIGIASLDATGHTLCNSNLKLEIIDSNEVTSNINIIHSPTCGDDNVTNDPDYTASRILSKVGKYSLKLTNLDTNKIVNTDIEVVQSMPFDIQRSSATRTNPFKSDRYPMIITITANEDYKGVVTEAVPSLFEIIWQGPAEVSQKGSSKILTWNVDMKKSETQVLKYEYATPKTDLGFHHFGSINIDGKQIKTSWQIVSNSQ